MAVDKDIIGKYSFEIGLFSGVFHQDIFKTDYIQNLVTNNGRTLILNRLSSNTANFINYMAIGTGATAATLADTTLGTETVRKAATPTVSGTPNWKVTFNAVFTAAEINGTTEVGLLNASSNGTLATRNVHTAISIPVTSTMGVDYIIQINTGYIGANWTKTGGQTYVYELAEPNDVKAVVEIDTGYGYVKTTSVANVNATANTYYYDSAADKVYVHCSDGASANTHSVLVLNGG